MRSFVFAFVVIVGAAPLARARAPTVEVINQPAQGAQMSEPEIVKGSIAAFAGFSTFGDRVGAALFGADTRWCVTATDMCGVALVVEGALGFGDRTFGQVFSGGMLRVRDVDKTTSYGLSIGGGATARVGDFFDIGPELRLGGFLESSVVDELYPALFMHLQIGIGYAIHAAGDGASASRYSGMASIGATF